MTKLNLPPLRHPPSSDAMLLRQRLKQYLNDVSDSLTLIKELGIIHLAAAYELIQNGQKLPMEEILSTVRLVANTSFLGTQDITSCVHTDYTNSSSYSERTGGYSHAYQYRRNVRRSNPYIAKSYRDAYANSEQRNWHNTNSNENYAYSENVCSFSVHRIDVKQSESVTQVSLSRLDQLILDWVNAIDVLQIQKNTAYPYPTHDSPYFKN